MRLRWLNSGFTLPEALVSVTILLVATTGAIVAFNLITQSVRGTGIRVEQNRVIDSDISVINLTSETFTSCEEPDGDNPSNPFGYCQGDDVECGNSFYYFPEIPDPDDDTTWTDAQDFRTACGNGTLRANFIAAIGGQADLADDVRRLAPATVAGSNHLVEITWVDPTRGNRPLRSIQVAPVVSSWCP